MEPVTKTQFVVIRCMCGAVYVMARTATAQTCPESVTVRVAACEDCNDDCWDAMLRVKQDDAESAA